MPTNRIPVEALLTAEEGAALDSFGKENRGAEALPRLAAFLAEKFSVKLEMHPDIVVGFAADSSNLPGRAEGIFRPKSERECAIAFRACFSTGTPFTISGGRSNLTGSATPQGGVVISAAKMLTPEVAVAPDSKTAVSPAGILMEDMREQVRKLSADRLAFPVDPTSRAEASMGGALACNCSGFTPGPTGAVREWVKSMRFLLPDGRLVAARRGEFVSTDGKFLLAGNEWPVPRYARPAIKNAGGPFSAPDGAMDFIDLVIGSEGLFGLVTACEVGLTERPKEYLDLFFSLPGEAEALRFLNAVLERFEGDLSSLGAFEYFGINCRKYMKHEKRFFRGDDGVGIYLQEPLLDKEMEDAAEVWLETVAEAKLDVNDESIALLDTGRLRALFMEARHSIPAHALEVVQNRGTYTIMTDTVVPPEQFPGFLEFAHGLLGQKKLDYLSFGHLGDCHLHFTILPDKEQIDAGVAAYDALVAKSAELGGVYSGEHGTGKRKRKDFLRCYGPEAVEQVRRAKAAVDPEFLLNRGNVFETSA